MIRKPDFFIVGAPKCGTTALNDYLAMHPDIYMARKEMHHFGADLRFGNQFYRRNKDAYLAEFDTWNGQSLVGEASVWYLFSQTAAEEIKQLPLFDYVVFSWRGEIDRAVSDIEAIITAEKCRVTLREITL